MARRNIRRDYENDTDEISLETTVPTDLSLSPDEFSDVAEVLDKKRKVSKQLLERKQLLHDIQVLKIELSQKSLIIDNMKADYMQKTEDLEERLTDALHQKQILQARLESELRIQQEEAKRRQEKIQKELDTILRRQQHLESTNERLQEKAVDIRHSLKDLELTENQYLDIKEQPEEGLSLKDFVAVKLFETVRPWKIESAELKSRCRAQGDELHRCSTNLERCREDLEEKSRKLSDLEVKHQRLTLAFAEVKSQVQHGDYKIENYDKVKKDRDEFETEVSNTKKQLAYLEAAVETTTKERDDLKSELGTLKQASALLKQDKDFFSRQASEAHNKLLYTEEKIIQLNDSLDRAKQAREELYDKYVVSRDQYKSEYEAKLREELEQIRGQTNTEIDRLKTSTREMFERENRNLREARDLALSERDRAMATEKDAHGKYEQLKHEYHHRQMEADNRHSDLSNEVRMKAFEAERSQLVYDEALRNFKESQVENDKLNKKLDVLKKEYFTLQTSMEKRVTELESQLNDKNTKLETYEKLEDELDDVIMQAAEVENEDEAERVLFSYGYGANIPTTAKRRLKQSMHLAKRVLQLERANTSLRKEIERKEDKNTELADQVKSANQILDQSQQPYHYLVDSVRQRDTLVTRQKEQISMLEKDVKRLERERNELSKSKNQMAIDLERLLNHKEEMSVMKQVVLSMNQRGKALAESDCNKRPILKSPKSAKGTGSKQKAGSGSKMPGYPRKGVTLDAPEKDENVHRPPPTQFTVKEPADWYKKLQQKKHVESKYNLMTK